MTSRTLRHRIRLGLAVLAMAQLADAAAGQTATPGAVLAADGRTFSVMVPGLSYAQGGFGATVMVGGQERELSSAGGAVMRPVQYLTEETPNGPAEVGETAVHFEQEQVDVLFRLGRVAGVPGVLAQAGIRNVGQTPVDLVAVTPVALTCRVTGSSAAWLITGLQDSMAAVRALDEIRTPLHVREAGGFYRPDGSGFLFGPVGRPTADIGARIASGRDGKFAFNLSAEMSGARVAPGATRWGQQVVLLIEPPRVAMARWAEWVAKTHGARTDKGALSGWNNWSFLKSKDIGSELLDVSAAVLKSGGHLRPEVIQIDITRQAGSELLDPAWLPAVAERVGATGARFGLRLGTDLGNPEPAQPGTPGATPEVSAMVRRAVQSGFTYLKVALAPATERAAGEMRTAFEIRRDAWAAIRQAAGEDTYLLGCGGGPDRAMVGSVDACRTGGDAGRRDLRSVINDVLRSYPLQGRWFAVDNDVYYLAATAEGMNEVAGGPPLVRTWMSMVGLSCGAAITSDPWYRKTYQPHWRNAEVLTPPAKEQTEVLGLGTDPCWTRLVGHVRRQWGDSTVALLWNNSTNENSLGMDFAAAGLDPKRHYAVWSFWDNRFLGVAKGGWTTPTLAPAGSQHLCFTDLDRTPNKPVLIGSGLHIYCGAAEIKHVTSAPEAMVIELTDAGARDGDLFVYSRRQPVLKAVAGCAVTGVTGAGENVWRISLADRQSGAAQRVELTILLPVTRQPWFWLLIALVVASLAFAAWRYLAGLRMQRRHGLAEERARIARDLHDEIGAGLTEIAMQSHWVGRDIACNAEAATLRRIERVCQSATALTRSIDEIVWTLNPDNDTLERFVNYLTHTTVQFLNATGLEVRLDVPAVLPGAKLSGKVRHCLFLAVREALNNAAKHARAVRVQIAIRVEAGNLHIRVEDDGCGFAPDQTGPAGTHEGIEGMRRRMEEIGGRFCLVSRPGTGTKVEFVAPL